MLLLSVDSSAITASAALTENGKVIKSEFLNAGLTHSETLMPMIDKVMSGKKYSELDAIAVSAGPGSFTGVRIGVATVKGLAFVNNTPCVSVSTLEAAAYNFKDENAVICAVMDARRMQFYNALFKAESGKITRLCADRAIGLNELLPELSQYKRVIAVGDGANLLCDNAELDNLERPSSDKIFQTAVGVAEAAQSKEKIAASALMPVYLRLSQAERELKLKK